MTAAIPNTPEIAPDAPISTICPVPSVRCDNTTKQLLPPNVNYNVPGNSNGSF